MKCNTCKKWKKGECATGLMPILIEQCQDYKEYKKKMEEKNGKNT